MSTPIQEKRPDEDLDRMADEAARGGELEEAERLRREARRMREEAE